MPALLAPGLWSLVASAGLTLSAQAGARVEARAEQVRPPVGENTMNEVLEVEPAIGLLGLSPTLRLEAGYAPRLTRAAGDGPDSDTWLQRAWVRARWHASPTWQLQARLTAITGTVDLFRVATAPSQPGEPPPVGQAAPVATTLDYRRYELVLGAEGRLNRHFDLRGDVALMQEGGASAAEREVLPLQRAALVRGDLAWRVTGRTSLAGVFSAITTHYFDVAVATGEPGVTVPRSWSNSMGRAEAVWRTSLTSHSRARAGAGLVLVDSGAPGTGPGGLKPFGEAALEGETAPGWPRFSGGLLVAAAPVEDRLSGTITQRAEARGWGALSPVEYWTLGASAMGARVMDGPTAREAFVAGELWLTRAVRDVFAISLGGRWTTQWPASMPGRTSLPNSRWVAFLSIQGTWRSHTP